MIDKTYLLKIKDEIQKDPEKIGYSGKTAEEIADLINKSRVIVTDVIYEEPPQPKVGDKIGEKVEEKPPRVNEILIGVAGAPNKLEISDIEEAMK